MISLGLHGAASRLPVRKHQLICASTSGRGQLNRPARPSQGGPNRGSSTGGGSSNTVSRNELVLYLQRLWGRVMPQVVETVRGMQLYSLRHDIGTLASPPAHAIIATAPACMFQCA
jgi:hypothetical protein